MLEHGVYTRLLDVYYLREDGIPQEQVYRLISANSRAEKATVDSILREFFSLEDGQWVQVRCQKVIAKYHAFVDKQSAAGKASAVKRALNAGSTTVQPPLDSGCNLIQPPTSHSPLPTTQSRIKNPSASATPAWFIEFKLAYPPRSGDQAWRKAERAANARISEGHVPRELIDGASRYAEFCRLSGKLGTEYVKQAASFLGPDKPFLLPWTPPPTKAQLAQDANVATSLEWLEKSNAPN